MLYSKAGCLQGNPPMRDLETIIGSPLLGRE